MFELHTASSRDLTANTISVPIHKPCPLDTGEGNYRNWELWESLARLDWTGLLANVDQTENSRKKAHGDAGSTLPHIQGAHRFLQLLFF